MSNTIENLQKGRYDLKEFTQEQKDFILALVKTSYNDGYEEGRAEVTNRVAKALEES